MVLIGFLGIYLHDDVVHGVMNFLLMSDAYPLFNFLNDNFTALPIYDTIKNYRCQLGFGPC